MLDSLHLSEEDSLPPITAALNMTKLRKKVYVGMDSQVPNQLMMDLKVRKTSENLPKCVTNPL